MEGKDPDKNKRKLEELTSEKNKKQKQEEETVGQSQNEKAEETRKPLDPQPVSGAKSVGKTAEPQSKVVAALMLAMQIIQRSQEFLDDLKSKVKEKSDADKVFKKKKDSED